MNKIDKSTNRLIIKWVIPVAVTLAVVAFLAGAILGVVVDPAWLSRMGSVVIVIGVLLAAIRLDERIPTLVDDFLSEHMPPIIESKLHEVRKSGGGLISEAEFHEQCQELIKEIKNYSDSFGREKHRVLGSYEVAIVCIGTIVNGFGEVALRALIACVSA